MRTDLRKICVVSGPSKEIDITRAERAISYRAESGRIVPIKILGAGPDLERALKHYRLWTSGQISDDEYTKRQMGLDHHLDMYNHIIQTTGERPEVVTSSVTLVQNVLHGFRSENAGSYAIVTEPWHYEKFERIQEKLKQKGRIPERLEFFNVPTPDTNYYTGLQKMAFRIKTELELFRA